MAHFAKVKNGKVLKVIVAEQSFVDALIDNEAGVWLKCSYNTSRGVHKTETPFRGNYPGVGWNYISSLDVFVPPKPFPSWTLNKKTYSWEPPTPSPVDGFVWDEYSRSWVEQELF